MFATSTYQSRRAGLASSLDSGLILLLGNEESSRNFRDNTYRFRQDTHFLYYFGLDQPHLGAIIDLDEGTTTLFGDDLSIDHIVWMGPQPTLAQMAARVGVERTAPYGEMARVLASARAAGRSVHYLPPYRAENLIKLHQWLGQSLAEVEQGASEALIRAMVGQISYKTTEEIAEIERAINISGAMHVAAMKAARPGMMESELVGIVEGIAVGAGGDLAFSVIMTINGQTLHNHYHGNILSSGRLVLGDFGAETDTHYAGDITRTFPVDKTFTTKQKEIYQIVLDAEMTAIGAIKPGVPYRDVHLLASRVIASGLKDLGLMKGDVREAVAAGAHALFFPHGLGHMMGMDVHDMEGLGEQFVGYDDTVRRSDQFGLRSLRLARALEPGFVLTVEPGIYFIPQLVDLWEKEKRFTDFIDYAKVKTYLDFGGVRIEDDVLVTASGKRVLGEPIPKTIAEVEALRG